MEDANKQAITVLHDWLESYVNSRNTYRAYYRELKRLQSWLLKENLNFIEVGYEHLKEYFSQYAMGMLDSSAADKKSKQISERTIFHARSILWRMFEKLRDSSLRQDNPAKNIHAVTQIITQKDVANRAWVETQQWHTIRKIWLAQPVPELGSRKALDRALAVAEISYWTAMRRSELAIAVMADFKIINGEWEIAVHRFGQRNVDNVHVPHPAMEALRRYRISRGLSPIPEESETSVPLISGLRSEHAVDPWTISHALRLASLEALVDQPLNPPCWNLSPRSLRRYLIVDGLSEKLPLHDLTTHVRSRYAVNVFSATSSGLTIKKSLAKLSKELAKRNA